MKPVLYLAILLCTSIRMQVTGSERGLVRRLVLERHIQKFINLDYGNIIIDMKKPDRKTFNLNITTYIYQVVNEMKIFAQVYKFTDNVYKPSAIKISQDVCLFLTTTQVGMFQTDNPLFKHYIVKCPIKKGKYWVHNVNETLVQTQFLPKWQGKVDYSFTISNTTLYHAEAYFNVIDS